MEKAINRHFFRDAQKKLREKLYDRVIAEAAQSADAQEDIWEAFVAQAMAEAEKMCIRDRCSPPSAPSPSPAGRRTCPASARRSGS